MNPVERVLGHLYAVYALLLFAATMLLVVLPIWATTLFPEPRRSRLLHPIFRLWMGIFMPLAGCPVLRKGKKPFARGRNYVVVCNHNSFVDVPVTSPWIPGPNKTLAKAEMARIPVFGIIYRAGSVLVDRRSEASRRESFNAMEKTLQAGLHLCLYPEGTRNKTGQPLQPFKDGAFTTAVRCGKPIIPGVIFNTGKILPNRPKFWAWPHVVRIHFLPPTETEGLGVEAVPQLRDAIRSAMEAYYVSNR